MGLHADASKPKLLIKIPTRERPYHFFKTLDTYYEKLSHEVEYHFLISCDIDDYSMNTQEVIQKFSSYPNLTASFSHNHSKVEAYNRDVTEYMSYYDMVLVTSDDMMPVADGYDKTIVTVMQESFPNYDGVLNLFDGFIGDACNSLPVIGKNFYNKFGYIYNPNYKSLFCDEELASVSKILKKEKIHRELLIKHLHPAWEKSNKSLPPDFLYIRNEALKERDENLYWERRARNFDLPEQYLEEAMPKLWSILICTVEDRQADFEKISTKLVNQINALGLSDQIEIVYFRDQRGQNSIGTKRNVLLQASAGHYISYVDDDDDVSDEFIKIIYNALQEKKDCVSLRGIMTHHGLHPRTFIHSVQYNSFFQHEGIYYRPPNHWNPIKRSIAIQFTFPDSNYGEDTEWAMKIARTGLLKTESKVDTPYYFYHVSDNPLSKYY